MTARLKLVVSAIHTVSAIKVNAETVTYIRVFVTGSYTMRCFKINKFLYQAVYLCTELCILQHSIKLSAPKKLLDIEKKKWGSSKKS